MPAGARVSGVGMTRRALEWLGSWSVTETETRAEVGDGTSLAGSGAGVVPPTRPAAPLHVSPDLAVTLSDVYRALSILAVSVQQLTVDQYRGPVPVTDRVDPLVRRPSLDVDPSEFYAMTALDLASCGNAYWRKIRSPLGATVLEVQLLKPTEMHVGIDRDTERVVYTWRGKRLEAGEVQHLKLLPRTGYPLGLGPIQAAQIELRGTLEARDYSSVWLSTTDIPTGVLTTDQVLTAEQAKTYKALWRGDGAGVDEPATDGAGHSIRVLGNGLRYAPLVLKPADIQFLETRKFNKTGIATLFGVPASLMLAAVEGNSQTYTNVEQEWIGYNRFTLMAYLRPIEAALSALLPHGNTARFNVDALLRTDTKTRYEAHEIGLRAGFLTVDEVRAIEGLGPMPAGARTTPTAQPTNQETSAA